jgi:hypothetical protein
MTFASEESGYSQEQEGMDQESVTPVIKVAGTQSKSHPAVKTE